MTPARISPRPALAVIVSAGLVAGVLDIGYVFVFYGVRGVAPQRILRGIAAALLGRDALSGGWGTAALGLAMHFGVAFVVATVFYVASRFLPVLIRHAIASGLIYGALVWLVMNALILPLTKTPPASFPPPNWWIIFVPHLFCVGVPIALMVKRGSAAR